MADPKKVLEGLEQCVSDGCTCSCTYFRVSHCLTTLEKDTLELLKEQQETIASLQGTICKLNAALAEQPEQKFFVDSDGKMIPLPIQKHGHWIMPRKFFLETQCSACKETYVGDYRTFNYCPNCGAIMDEKVVECRCK